MACSISSFHLLMRILLFLCCSLLQRTIAVLTIAIFAWTELFLARFQVCSTRALISGLSLSLLSNLNRPFPLFLFRSKQVRIGLWSDPLYMRYSTQPEWEISNQWLLAKERSSRHRTTSLSLSLLPRTPLQDRKSPVWGRSKRSHSDIKVPKSMKDASDLVCPPVFS